jgi:hypothetical protein
MRTHALLNQTTILFLIGTLILISVFAAKGACGNLFSENFGTKSSGFQANGDPDSSKMKFVSPNSFTLMESELLNPKITVSIDGKSSEFDLLKVEGRSEWKGMRGNLIRMNIAKEKESYSGYFYLGAGKYVFFPSNKNQISIVKVDQNFVCGKPSGEK